MKTINGTTLKMMIISGSNNLYNHYPEIDALNVFPVPDGDTGTNMNLTMASGAKEIQNRNDLDVYTIAKTFSRGLLMGARGNSGVILSQIFRGFAYALEGKDSIGVRELSDAFMNGKDVAYKAVMRPVEGTILTVIRESATYLHDNIEEVNSIEKAFEYLIKEAHASLERTPDLLPVLKKVGVVDSGAAGLIKILEGFQSALKGKVIERQTASVLQNKATSLETGEIRKYRTELILTLPEHEDDTKKEFSQSRFTNWLSIRGDDFRIEKHDLIIKLHIITHNPGTVISFCQQYGEFDEIHVDNVSTLNGDLLKNSIFSKNSEQDKTEEEKEYALIAVAAGEGIVKMFKELRVEYIVSGGQTMNPSTEDFVKVLETCNAKNIFILPNNSNIILAATQACDVFEGKKNVKVIPSKSIPQGLVACMMFNPEADMKENYAQMNDALSNVSTGQVTFAIKDTKIDNVDIIKDHFIGIRNKTIVCCHQSKFDAAKELVDKMIDDMTSIITLIYGADVTDEEANTLMEEIKNKYLDIDVDLHKGEQPVYSFIIGIE